MIRHKNKLAGGAMTQTNSGASRATNFDSEYREAAKELTRFLVRMGNSRSSGWGLGGLFGKAAEKTDEKLFVSDPAGPDIGADHAASAANHHLEGIRIAIDNYLIPDRKGNRRGLQSLVMDINEHRNPLLVYGGPLPKRPDGLFVLANQSNNPPPKSGREALYNDVQTLIKMAQICEQDFEDKRRQGKGYHTEHGYGRISYLQWLNSYVESRKSGKTHAQSLPGALKARIFRKIGKPKQAPKNTP